MRKSYFIIALSLFVGVNNINAQDSLLVDPAKIDSLHQLIESHSNADKEKVRLLNEYARLCFYNREYKKGLIATKEARELSDKIKYGGGLAMYHMTLGVFAQGVGNLTEYHQMEAGVLATETGVKALLQVPDVPIGYPHPLTEEKLTKLQASLDYFISLGDKEIQATVLYPIVLFYNQNNQPDKRDQMLDQFIALYKSMNRIDPVILGYRHKVQVSQSVNNQTGVDSLIHEVTNLVSQTDNITGLSNYLLSFISSDQLQYASAIGYLTKSVDLFEKAGNKNGQAVAYGRMVFIYQLLGMHAYRADIFERFLPILKESNIENSLNMYRNAAWANYNIKNYDKAWEYLDFITDSLKLTDAQFRFMKTQKTMMEGQILMDQEKYTESIPLLFETYQDYESTGNRSDLVWSATHLANCYYKLKDYKSALQYAISGYNVAFPVDLRFFLKANLQLADIYEALGKKDSAYTYLRRYQRLLVESNILQNTNQILGIQINSVLDKSNEQINRLEQESLLKEQKNKNQQLLIFSTIGALLSTLLILFILYRNNKNKQKANTVLEQTLSNLKSAQYQLIQSEKMASLGELTAGIAHEIQNPLNFVNNFSEVNKELLVEMKDEIEKGNLDSVKALADDVIENQEKINHHGKRADAIVKGMLQHSRSSSGVKEPTDVNTLADEYLRLAYHGLRAKDKSFNAMMKTDFDEQIGFVNVIPQDIGRVILNLITNAFYAVSEKKKQQHDSSYEPTVSVTTKKSGNKVLITISDNGHGIPQNVLEKIFQPFFTTKPTGQGTGLGLSLSYDIVKAHGGELKVNTKENEGTEFTISLPA